MNKQPSLSAQIVSAFHFLSMVQLLDTIAIYQRVLLLMVTQSLGREALLEVEISLSKVLPWVIIVWWGWGLRLDIVTLATRKY
jgi:hypothetical protein